MADSTPLFVMPPPAAARHELRVTIQASAVGLVPCDPMEFRAALESAVTTLLNSAFADTRGLRLVLHLDEWIDNGASSRWKPLGVAAFTGQKSPEIQPPRSESTSDSVELQSGPNWLARKS